MTLLLIIGTIFIASVISIYFAILSRFRCKLKQNVPKDVVVLFQVGRGPNAPSVSPFPLKLETFLRMAKIPYLNDHSGKFSTKGKTPWMQYNDESVADSQFCIEHLKKQRGLNLNENLTPAQVSEARAFQKMTEENLYWTMCSEMFGEDTTAVRTVIPYTGLKLSFTLWFLRRVLRKEMWGHGIGRHTREEIWTIGEGDMTALSNFIGNKKFLMGDDPCEADCAVFGMLAMILWNMPTSRHERLLHDKLTNLVQYCERMKTMFWPDWDKRVLKSENYQNDAGHIYFQENMTKSTNG